MYRRKDLSHLAGGGPDLHGCLCLLLRQIVAPQESLQDLRIAGVHFADKHSTSIIASDADSHIRCSSYCRRRCYEEPAPA